MRWMFPAALALACISSEGPAQDARELPPPCHCFFEKSTKGLQRVDSVGDAWIDKRIRTESNHLKVLFRVDADVVLLGKNAPRNAFVTRDASGKITVFLKAAWMAEQCANGNEHRLARTAYALAHQYAHALQERIGCKLSERARELHAEMLAGWFLGRRNIATLKGAPPLNPSLAPLLFGRAGRAPLERYDRGTPKMRADALAMGFRLWRTDRLSLGKVCKRGLNLYPPANVGLVGANARVPGPLRAAMNQMRLKVECQHQGPCQHKIACTHLKSKQVQSPCTHIDPCNHRKECTHRVACRHRMQCVHRVRCKHKIQCVHTIPCVHKEHEYDLEHPCDYDEYGVSKKCVHRIPCVHFKHRHDFLHNFDYEHEFDYAHEFDRQHDFDLEHEFDTEHDGHPRHDFDMVEVSEPIHPHDLAHESDPVHDYDIELKSLDGKSAPKQPATAKPTKKPEPKKIPAPKTATAQDLALACGTKLLAAWRNHAPAAPAKVLYAPAAKDPWGNLFQVRFSRAEGNDAKLKLAWIHSDGPDGKPETADDVEFVLYRDGTLKKQ